MVPPVSPFIAIERRYFVCSNGLKIVEMGVWKCEYEVYYFTVAFSIQFLGDFKVKSGYLLPVFPWPLSISYIFSDCHVQRNPLYIPNKMAERITVTYL